MNTNNPSHPMAPVFAPMAATPPPTSASYKPTHGGYPDVKAKA